MPYNDLCIEYGLDDDLARLLEHCMGIFKVPAAGKDWHYKIKNSVMRAVREHGEALKYIAKQIAQDEKNLDIRKRLFSHLIGTADDVYKRDVAKLKEEGRLDEI